MSASATPQPSGIGWKKKKKKMMSRPIIVATDIIFETIVAETQAKVHKLVCLPRRGLITLLMYVML